MYASAPPTGRGAAVPGRLRSVSRGPHRRARALFQTLHLPVLHKLAAGLLLAAGLTGMSTPLQAMSSLANTQEAITLSCTASAKVPGRHLDGMCDAMERLLTARSAHPVRRVSDADPQTGCTAPLHVHLHLPKGSATGLTARLDWCAPNTSGRDPVTGPLMNFGVADTTLDARFYDRFSLQVYQSNSPPLP